MKKLSSILLNVSVFCIFLISCTEDDPEIKITSFTFNSASVEVVEGTNVDLNDYIVVEGEDADQAQVTFTSDNEEVVSVNETTLTAAGVGSAKVEATETNTNQTATIDVTVIAKVVAVTGVTLDKETADLKVGEDLQLTATVAPENATEKGLIWSVAFPPESKTKEVEPTDIATVSETGLVTAVSAGDVVVTATTKDGEFTASVDLSISIVNVTGVSIGPNPITIAGSTTLQLTANIVPENAADKTVTWSLVLEEQAGDVKEEIAIAIAIGTDYYADIDVETGVITSKRACNNCGLMAMVKTTDGEFTDKLPVEITYVAVSSIILDPTSFSVDIGATQQMTATIEPENASDKNVNWSLEFTVGLCDANPTDFASVSETGLVTGIGPEACGLVVKATSESGSGLSTTAAITVNPILATSVSIRDGDGLEIPGKSMNLDYTDPTTLQFHASVLPANVSDNSVTWSVTDNGFFSVSATGLVTIISGSPGGDRVTITANDGSGLTDYVDFYFEGIP